MKPGNPRRRRSSGGCNSTNPETGNGNGSVKILPHLSNYPITNSPRMDPVNSSLRIAPLGQHSVPEGSDGDGGEVEGRVRIGIGDCVFSGEQAHEKLVRGRAVEPPLEIRGDEAVDGGDVSGA